MSKDSIGSNQQRIALTLQYEGSGFCGWQRQKDRLSVQGTLENAISQLDICRPINTFAAGRTDSGVHAAGQVVHFDCSGIIPVNRWPSALNGRLPKTIRVLEAIERPLTWHACHSAKYRRYRYTIYNARRPNVFLLPWTWHRYQVKLDDDLMRIALEGLLGCHDFAAFQRSGSKRINARTTIQAIQLDRRGDLVSIEIQATGFLYGMVRLIIGQLVALGEHKISFPTFERRWKKRLRQEVKEAAPSQGLCLLRVGYEEMLFSKSLWFDCFPHQNLLNEDPPLQSFENQLP